MFRGRGIFRILIGVLLIAGLLTLGGYFGYSQGFTAGIAATDGAAVEGGARAFGPYPYPYHYGYGFGLFPFFFGFGLIFKLFFFFFILMFIGKLFRFGRWRMAGGPGGWGKHPGWHHHGPPPWTKEREGSEEQKDADDPVGEAKTK